MLSIYETYCDIRDLTIGKKNVFIRYFREPVEAEPANELSLDGAIVAEIVYFDNLSIELRPWKIIGTACVNYLDEPFKQFISEAFMSALHASDNIQAR